MTLFGIDISNNNGPNLNLTQVKAEGFDFVFCKVTEGSYFRDQTWPAYRDAAKAAGLIVAGYHYLTTDPIDAQADLFLDQLGDPNGEVGIMVDFEMNGGGQENYWAFVRAINARGREVNLSYEPRWYWQRIGSPQLGDLPGLIQSSYVSGGGYASALYPGDDSTYWAGFGGDNVDILQFSDQGSVAGNSLDVNAFRGTRDELAALVYGKTEGAKVAVPEEQTPVATEKFVADFIKGFDGPIYATAAAVLKELTGSTIVGEFPGFENELGGRTVVGFLGALGEKLGIEGCHDPKAGA